ncbi:MAG: hypothetical protein JXC32_12845 [Anaerolineae bacterium]|nr:hypothetical protein [Anaerolineae bacterium]
MPEAHVFLVVDDGTDLVPALTRRLQAMGWPMVLLRPSSGMPAYVDSPVVFLENTTEAAVRAALDEVRASYGPVAGCVVTCTAMVGALPTSPTQVPYGAGLDGPPPCSRGGVLAGLADRDDVRLAFLLAKHLSDSLTDAARQSWGGFFTVVRLDGALSMTGAADGLTAAAGMTGLTKTLRLEWPVVVSRAIDLAPELATDAAADAVVAEVLDPNRAISEVGWGEGRRVTLVAEVESGTEEMTDGAY